MHKEIQRSVLVHIFLLVPHDTSSFKKTKDNEHHQCTGKLQLYLLYLCHTVATQADHAFAEVLSSVSLERSTCWHLLLVLGRCCNIFTLADRLLRERWQPSMLRNVRELAGQISLRYCMSKSTWKPCFITLVWAANFYLLMRRSRPEIDWIG